MPTYIMIAGDRLIHARSTSTTTLFLTTGNSGRLYALLVTAAVWCVPFFRYRLVVQSTYRRIDAKTNAQARSTRGTVSAKKQTATKKQSDTEGSGLRLLCCSQSSARLRVLS